MQASDLPEPARKMLLDQLRQQIGREQYDRLLDQAGEDAVLEQLVRAIEAGGAPKPKKKERIWPWLLGFGIVLLLMVFGGPGTREVLATLCVVFVSLFWLFGKIAEWWDWSTKNWPRL